MRRKMIAGNWKMNLNRAESEALAGGVAAGCGKLADSVDLVVFPPSPYLDAVRIKLQGSQVGLGAQNVYHESNGAFTGEISVAMLQDLSCKYVILGHSERRHILGETDPQVQAKTLAALAGGLIPIVCVGELLAERESSLTMEVIERQFDGSLGQLTAEQLAKVIIAYEPVWAIGTGKVATPVQAEEVHRGLRKIVAHRYNSTVSQQVRILYGGSVKASNAGELLSQENIDGALVGGASLKAEEFLGIARESAV